MVIDKGLVKATGLAVILLPAISVMVEVVLEARMVLAEDKAKSPVAKAGVIVKVATLLPAVWLMEAMVELAMVKGVPGAV